MQKAFKPPLLVKRPSGTQQRPLTPLDDEPPAAKRRRTSDNVENEQVPSSKPAPKIKPQSTFQPPRRVLSVVENESSPENKSNEGGSAEGYYTVLWYVVDYSTGLKAANVNHRRKFTTKKHKTWDGDGVLSVRDGYANLQDIDGRVLGRTAWKTPLFPESSLSIGGKDVEVDSLISKADFLAGKPFLGGVLPKKPAVPTFTSSKPKPKIKDNPPSSDIKDVPIKAGHAIPKRSFKAPLLQRSESTRPSTLKNVPQPRHDPHGPDALVMKRPASVPKGKQVVDVVLDPLLTHHLRPHQRQGVQFLYECVMGLREYSGEGAILADEMGLGKTLQTIALLWTLLRQNPVYEDSPVVKKALIVCPVTLIDNWRKEFRKWLGPDRIGVFVIEDKKTRLTDFTKGKIYSVMIVGYEKLRLIQDDLKKGSPIDIVIVDEGHRLKTAQNKSALAIKSLNTERRVILSGTPIQNDLSEFFTMVDFVNPGLLNKYNVFKREFENPILKSRQPNATAAEIEKGEARSEELANICSQFILRRTAEVISKFLPPKTETVLFCRPTAAQVNVYKAILQSPVYGTVLGSTELSLQLINILKKVCNSPSLFLKGATEDTTPNEAIKGLVDSIDPAVLKVGAAASAKLQVLDTLLHQLRTSTTEKIVLVSNYTSTLDMLAALLSSLDYTYLRLDGKTPASQRQSLVDKFNNSPPAKCFAFLLSAKAGGTGLNLIGASRLVLFDSDWNPATDLQAMARIHRDGQKKPCYIYRLLIQGALDEKIYQRQLTKTGLADAVVDAKKTAQGFTREELKDLFRLEGGDGCRTHDLLGCECGGTGNSVTAEDPGFGLTMDDSAAEEDEDEEELPDIGVLVNASKVDMEEQERRIKDKARKARKQAGGEKMLALTQYLHIDAERVRGGDEGLETLVEDHVLLSVVKEQGSRVDFVFAKTTG
jgi:DNA repair and recombination protein RAD54B